ncbi:MAG: hypothetical protein QOG62_1784 [Thermoleophilaceae bacterium]|jgi:hypothetical protein|nr:hypothetical protein [Thermoleophilaceae bacterium]
MSSGDGMNDSHGRHTDSAAAYLLGALPELESAAFERHVMGCAECRDQLELLRPAAEALPRSVEPVLPSPGLKRDLMRQVRADLEPAPAAPARPGPLARLRSSLTPRVGRIKPAMAWVSAAFLLGMGVVAGLGASNLIGDSHPKVYAAHVSPTVAPQGTATLETEGNNGDQGAVLSVAGMPTLPSSDADKAKVYQLWLVRGGRVAPGAIFSVGADGSGYGTIPGSIEDVDKVLVTREPAGGAKAPSEDPVIDVTLS